MILRAPWEVQSKASLDYRRSARYADLQHRHGAIPVCQSLPWNTYVLHDRFTHCKATHAKDWQKLNGAAKVA